MRTRTTPVLKTVVYWYWISQIQHVRANVFANTNQAATATSNKTRLELETRISFFAWENELSRCCYRRQSREHGLTQPIKRLAIRAKYKRSLIVQSQVIITCCRPTCILNIAIQNDTIVITWHASEVVGLLHSKCWLFTRVSRALISSSTHMDRHRPTRRYSDNSMS